MNKKRLILIVPTFPTNTHSSHIVPFVQQFVLAFKKQYDDIDVKIIALYLSKKGSYTWNNIEVIALGLSMKRIFKAGNILKGVLKANRLVRKSKNTGILSFWYSDAAIIGLMIAFVKRIKHYTWLQGQDVLKPNKYMRLFRPKAKSLLALSDYQNKMLIESFHMSAHKIVPIGINPSSFPNLNTRHRTYDLMCAASLIPLKNITLFLEIASELKNTIRDIKVLVVGSGPTQNELEEFVEKNDLRDNVSFMGLVPHKEVLNLMNNTKVFILTSKFEGGGNVCHEALYSGCQVISTLPIINKKNVPAFYYLSNKSDIIKKAVKLIKQFPEPKRTIVNNLNASCKTIYDLYFN